MKKRLLILLTVLAAFLFVSGSAMAIPYNERPYMGVEGDDLQNTLNAKLLTGSIDAIGDQSSVGGWTESEANVDSYLVSMIGGVSGELGVYSLSTERKYTLVGADNKTGGFDIDNSGFITVNRDAKEDYFGTSFGFYWKNNEDNTISFTEDSKNDGNALALTYLIQEGWVVETFSETGSLNGVTAKSNNDWILAFEDEYSTSDNGGGDFNDALFYVEDADPVPEPAMLLLLGTGLVGFAGFARRRRSAKS